MAISKTYPPGTPVYSYRRFSSGRQSSGHSLERQTESARKWCAEQGLQLDESLALADLGVSAYTGDNVARGALAGFLAAAETGRVPKGAILLVESLDRLSRATIPDAMAVLTNIVRSGIRVVSLIDGHEWNEKTIEDTTSFMLSVLLFARAHNESSTKAKRVSDQFQKKRAEKRPVVSRGHGPGWAVALPDNSAWVLDEERAESVRKTFELAAAGYGGIAIARQANQEGWPLPWRKRANTSTRWEHTGVSRLLRDRRTLGEWQPKKMIEGKLTPDGPPVQDYFPRVIPDELWHRVVAALSTREGPTRVRGIKADVFSGLLYCKCGERMDRKAPAARGYPRYYCLGRKNGASNCPAVAETAIVKSVLSGIAQIEQAAFNPESSAEEARTTLTAATAKLEDLRRRAERLLDALEGSDEEGTLIRGRLNAVRKEIATTEQVIVRTQAHMAAAPVLDPHFGQRIAAMAADAIANKDEVAERSKLSEGLWQVVKKIVWTGSYFMVYARSGEAFGINPPPETLQRAKNRNTGKPRGLRQKARSTLAKQ